jgi:hypothetical protein
MKTAWVPLTLVFFSALAAAQMDATRLAGTWETPAINGTVTTLYFQANGQLTVSSSAVQEFSTYRQADELVGIVRGSPEYEVRLRITAGELTYTPAGAPPQRWVRLGQSLPGAPFAGVWALAPSELQPLKRKKRNQAKAASPYEFIPPEIRANIRMLITPEGQVRIRMPLETHGGSYTIQGDKLILLYSGRVQVSAFRFEADALHLLAQGDAADTVFARVR